MIMKSKVGMKITISENGPYRVEGSVPLAKQTIVTNDDGVSVEWRQSDEFETKVTYNLCRCGQSASQPFCDASHTRVGFDGTETASRVPYLQRGGRSERSDIEDDGPTVSLRRRKIL